MPKERQPSWVRARVRNRMKLFNEKYTTALRVVLKEIEEEEKEG